MCVYLQLRGYVDNFGRLHCFDVLCLVFKEQLEDMEVTMNQVENLIQVLRKH